MIQIISGTDRPESRSLEVANNVQKRFSKIDVDSEVIALCQLNLNEFNGEQYGGNVPEGTAVHSAIEKVNSSDGLYFVIPEYNGSYPGALKYFIDHWTYPDSFESRPVALLGLGGTWGGLRPVEHLQGVFGYRNAYIFPERVFVNNVWEKLKEGSISDDLTNELLDKQTKNFSRFIKALKSEDLSK